MSFTSLAAQSKAGLSVVKGAYTVNGDIPAPNGACMNMLYQMGPFNGADPIDKFGVFDVKRTNDGLYADKVLVNGYKMQAAFEALNDAGVVTPYVALAKNRLDTDAAVYNETSPGFFPWMSFGNLPHNKQVYWGGAGVSSATTGIPIPVLAETGGGSLGRAGYAFDNGVTLTPAPRFTGTTVGGDLLLDSNDVVPNLSFFSLPLGPGDVTTLNPSGAAYEAALSAGDVQEAVVQAGFGQTIRGLMPDPVDGTPVPPISGFQATTPTYSAQAQAQAQQAQSQMPYSAQAQQAQSQMPYSPASYAPSAYAPSAYPGIAQTEAQQRQAAVAAYASNYRPGAGTDYPSSPTPYGSTLAQVPNQTSTAYLQTGSPFLQSPSAMMTAYSCSQGYPF